MQRPGVGKPAVRPVGIVEQFVLEQCTQEMGLVPVPQSRHFCATTLMSNGVDPQEVQKMLRHANLRVTLEAYVHWLPKMGRPRGVIGSVLTKASQERRKPRKIG